jgi:hypothetical protein
MSYHCRKNFHSSIQIPIIFPIDNEEENEEEECLRGGLICMRQLVWIFMNCPLDLHLQSFHFK